MDISDISPLLRTTWCQSAKKTQCIDLVKHGCYQASGTIWYDPDAIKCWRNILHREQTTTVVGLPRKLWVDQIGLLAPSSWHQWNNDKCWHQELQIQISQIKWTWILISLDVMCYVVFVLCCVCVMLCFVYCCVCGGTHRACCLMVVGNQMEIRHVETGHQ